MAKTKANPNLNKNDISDLKNKVDGLENKWRRALADYDNLEKRIVQEKEELTKFFNAGLIEKILVIVDDLQRATKYIKDKGLNMILNKLKSILTSEGLEELSTEGSLFDPVTMDCVDLVKGADNIVVEEVQKGYLFKGRILRPAKVKVGKGGPPAPKAVEDK